jgi:hypothetical protein
MLHHKVSVKSFMHACTAPRTKPCRMHRPRIASPLVVVILNGPMPCPLPRHASLPLPSARAHHAGYVTRQAPTFCSPHCILFPPHTFHMHTNQSNMLLIFYPNSLDPTPVSVVPERAEPFFLEFKLSHTSVGCFSSYKTPLSYRRLSRGLQPPRTHCRRR